MKPKPRQAQILQGRQQRPHNLQPVPVLSVACPVCGAGAGQWCVRLTDGEPMVSARHRDRHRLAVRTSMGW